MDKKPSQHVDRAQIQQNVTRLALVIFFVATVSAAGGFLQGERVATSGISNVAAVTDYSFLKPNQCSGGKCIVPRDGGQMLFLCPPAGGNCSVTAKPDEGDAVTRELNPEESKALRDKMKELGGDEDKEEDKKEGDCPAGSTEPGCLDKCTTTFVRLADSKPEVAACIESPEDPVRKAMDKVARVCADAKGDWKNVWKAYKCDEEPVSETEFGGADVLPSGERRSAAVLFAATTGRLCAAAKKELSQAIKTSLEKGKKPPKTVAAPSCDLGAIVCFAPAASYGDEKTSPAPDDGSRWDFRVPEDRELTATALLAAETPATSQKAECCNKHDKACLDRLNKMLGRTPASTIPPAKDQCTGNLAQRALCSVRQGIDKVTSGLNNGTSPFGGQNPLGGSPGGGSPGGGSPNNNSGNQCPAGYTQSTENGRIVCDKKEDESAKPQCLLVASKEEIQAGETVLLRWRTANAERVDISDVGTSVSKNSQKSVQPTKTTTYTLTATGKGSDNKKTCDVTVTVSGTTDDDSDTGPTGSSPPKIACTPTTIPTSGTSALKWACPAGANGSTGTGIDTNNKVSGEVNVSPSFNTEYAVACTKDGEEIGKDSCSVSVGEPTYDLLVHPTSASRGDRIRVSWASLFMRSCRVVGPRGFDYTRTQGVVITEPFTTDDRQVPNRNIRSAIYSIECEDQFSGKIVSKDVTVRFVE